MPLYPAMLISYLNLLIFLRRKKMKNKCEQTGCLLNTEGLCIYYREPVWEGFGTKECCEETNKMLEVEEESRLSEKS